MEDLLEERMKDKQAIVGVSEPQVRYLWFRWWIIEEINLAKIIAGYKIFMITWAAASIYVRTVRPFRPDT